MQRLTPTAEQAEVIARMASEPTRAALSAAGLGTGKTLMLVETAKALGASTTLVSAPLHTRYSWQDTFQRQGIADFRWINNSTKAGRAALADLQWGRPGAYFMGRELARLMDWSEVRPDMVGHDECHSFASSKSRGFKNAMRLESGFTLAQSATWFGASFANAWTMARVLWPDRSDAGDIADRSFYRWQARWCETVFDNFAPMQRRVVGEKNPGEFVKALPCYIHLPSRMDEATVVPVYVDLSPRQRKMYDDMERQGVAWLDEHPLAADQPMTQRIRLRQLTLGECSINEEGEVVFAPDARSTMLTALTEMLDNLGDEKVLIVTDSAKFARLVASRIPSAFAWTGDKKEREREEAKQQFIYGDLKYIVATQAAISEGTDGLQLACHIGIELSRSDQAVLGEQVVGRLNRTGQTMPVTWYQLLARDTIDDPQAETLLQKKIQMRQSMRLTGSPKDSSVGNDKKEAV